MKPILHILVLFFLGSCVKQQEQSVSVGAATPTQEQKSTYLTILGTIQDAGSPHIACKRDCCKALFAHPDPDRQVIALGLVDNDNRKKYLFEATPDIARQLKSLQNETIYNTNEMVDGIFLTHAHIGHYTGLMYLGKEATNAQEVPVFAMPKMTEFLQTNGPWSQLVSDKNIALQQLKNEQAIQLTANLRVTPFVVPHRDEYSETVGYTIIGPNKTALFIPDIDKWSKWNKNIIEEIKKVDYAFLDATFYSGTELNNRDISQIPHPFMIESAERFKGLNAEEKSKIIFIHFNHTNPVINADSPEAQQIKTQGFRIGSIYDEYAL